jgi:predicted AAA+ superfamily ATPase
VLITQREINGLVEAMIAYNLKDGLILTDNEYDTIKVDGFQITVIPIWRWLLDL